MANEKKYPFSFRKHGHDIEFRRNRCYNICCDMEIGDIPWDDAKYDRLTHLYDQLTDVLTAYVDNNQIAWLTSTQYRIAKESADWATITRGAIQK